MRGRIVLPLLLGLLAALPLERARAQAAPRVSLQGVSGALIGPNSPLDVLLRDGTPGDAPLGTPGNPLSVQGGGSGIGSTVPTGTPNDGKTASSAVPVMGPDDKALASQTTLTQVLTALGGGQGLAVPTIVVGSLPPANSNVVPTTDTADGAAGSSPAVANAGTGLLGWLSTIAGQLGGYLRDNLYVGTTAVSLSAPLPTVSGTFTRVPLDTTTVGTANQYQTAAAAGTGTHEVCVANTTPFGTSGLLYIDPAGTGASSTVTTLSSTARLIDPPQSSTTKGDLVCVQAAANAVTLYATSTNVTFRGWKG